MACTRLLVITEFDCTVLLPTLSKKRQLLFFFSSIRLKHWSEILWTNILYKQPSTHSTLPFTGLICKGRGFPYNLRNLNFRPSIQYKCVTLMCHYEWYSNYLNITHNITMARSSTMLRFFHKKPGHFCYSEFHFKSVFVFVGRNGPFIAGEKWQKISFLFFSKYPWELFETIF